MGHGEPGLQLYGAPVLPGGEEVAAGAEVQLPALVMAGRGLGRPAPEQGSGEKKWCHRQMGLSRRPLPSPARAASRRLPPPFWYRTLRAPRTSQSGAPDLPLPFSGRTLRAPRRGGYSARRGPLGMEELQYRKCSTDHGGYSVAPRRAGQARPRAALKSVDFREMNFDRSIDPHRPLYHFSPPPSDGGAAVRTGPSITTVSTTSSTSSTPTWARPPATPPGGMRSAATSCIGSIARSPSDRPRSARTTTPPSPAPTR